MKVNYTPKYNLPVRMLSLIASLSFFLFNANALGYENLRVVRDSETGLPLVTRSIKELTWDDADAQEVFFYFRAIPAMLEMFGRLREMDFSELRRAAGEKSPFQYYLS